MGITTAIFLALTLFAIQSKFDLTTMWIFPLILMVTALGLGFAAWLTQIPWLHLIYCAIGIVAFSIYIVIDTQMMIGGRGRKVTIAPEDYIYCCLSLYIDLTNMFIFVMSLMKSARQ